MPTSSRDVAISVLDALSEVDPLEWAMLHREADIHEGGIDSDLDIATNSAPIAVVRKLVPKIHDRDLRIIQAFPYDVCELTTIIATADGSDGVQLDLLRDRHGAGICGIRSPELLTHKRWGVRYPRLDDLDTDLYLLRKRHVKGDRDRALQHLQRLGRYDRDAPLQRAEEVFGPRAFRQVRSLLAEGIPASLAPAREERGLRYAAARRFRQLRRAAKPAGVVIEFSPDERELADAVAHRLARFCIQPVVADHGWLGSSGPSSDRSSKMWIALQATRARLVLAPRGHKSPVHRISTGPDRRVEPILASIVDRLSIKLERRVGQA